MPRIEAVTFDFFNTLATHRGRDGGRGRRLIEYLRSRGLECDPWEHQALYDVFEPHGREYAPGLSPAEKHAYRCRLAERVFERLNVRCDKGEAGIHAVRIWELIGPDSLEVFPDVEPTLQRLRVVGYRLAVLSNWHCGLSHFCHELGVARWFDHVFASAEIGSQKPDRLIFDEACSRLGVPADHVLHVGDTVVDDVEGALGAGLRAVLIARNAAGSTSACPTIAELSGILEIVESLNTGQTQNPA